MAVYMAFQNAFISHILKYAIISSLETPHLSYTAWPIFCHWPFILVWTISLVLGCVNPSIPGNSFTSQKIISELNSATLSNCITSANLSVLSGESNTVQGLECIPFLWAVPNLLLLYPVVLPTPSFWYWNFCLWRWRQKKTWSHSAFSEPSVSPALIDGPTFSLSIPLILAYSPVTPYVPQYFYLQLCFALSDFAPNAQAILFVFLLCCLVFTSCVFLGFFSSRGTPPAKLLFCQNFSSSCANGRELIFELLVSFLWKTTISLMHFFSLMATSSGNSA